MTRCPPRVQCRGVVPAVSHIMLHSDTLAQEFNEILNGVEIFAPFQPLDPAVTFYAPLRNNVRDLRLNQDDFQRASDAWYKDSSGVYRNTGINRPRFEESRLLMEPAGTNVHECYSANPDAALSGWSTVSLSPGAVFERVQDVAELAAAGLQDICTSGFVFRIDNRAASGASYVLSAGLITDGANILSALYWRGDGSARNRLGGQVGTLEPLPASYEHNIQQWGALASNQRHRIEVNPSGDLYFILPEFQDAVVISSPIVTEGTAGQRAIDALSYDNPSSFFNQSAGMALIDWRASFDSSEMFDGNWTENLLATDEDRFTLLFLRSPAAQSVTIRSQMANGQTAQGPALSFNAGDAIRFAVRWNRTANQFQVGQRINSGPWAWGTEITSNLTDFDLGNNFYVNYLPAVWPSRSGDVYLYNEDRGRAWIEGNH